MHTDDLKSLKNANLRIVHQSLVAYYYENFSTFAKLSV